MPPTAPPPSTNRILPLQDGSDRSRDLQSEALAGGAYGGLLSVGQVIALSRINDDAQRKYGDRVWDLVDRDQAAGCSVDLLCYATLANDLQVEPAKKSAPGKAPETPEEQADVDNAAMAAEHVSKTMAALRTPFAHVAKMQLHEALIKGANVSDKVWELEPDDNGNEQLVLRAIKPKDRRTWLMEVDYFYNLLYIVGSSGSGMAWDRWPREKFVVMTWGGRGGDPRGESVYTRAVEPWNFRVQLPEDHFRYLKRFGTPKVVGKLSPGSMAGGLDGGTDLTTSPKVNPLSAFLGKLLQWINGAALAVGQNDVVEVHDVKSEGAAFVAAMDFYAREIVKAVVLSTRATSEAQHGSKADSETSMDVLGNMIRFLRKWLCSQYTADVFYYITKYRFGDDFARKYTPTASLGEVEHQDIMDLMTGLAKIGYSVQPSQFPELDSMLGIAVRMQDEVEKEPVPGLNSAATGDEQKQEDATPAKKAA